MPRPFRAFVAIDVDDELRQEVRKVQEQFRASRAHVNWVDPEACHLTLKFLGAVAEEDLGAINDACREVAAASAPFQLTFRGIGVFPHFRNLRVLWMGISDGDEELRTLQARVEERISPLGYPAESRSFEPHLTLGRVKEPLSRAQMLYFHELTQSYQGVRFGLARAGAFQLMRSTLLPSGAVHSVLESFALGDEVVPADQRSAESETDMASEDLFPLSSGD